MPSNLNKNYFNHYSTIQIKSILKNSHFSDKRNRLSKMAVKMRELVEHIPLELLVHKHMRPYLTGENSLTTEEIVKLAHGICNTKDHNDKHVDTFTQWCLLILDRVSQQKKTKF